jgi:trigger factor
MQISLESTSNLGRKMTVEVSPDRIDPEVEKRLKAMSQRVKISGFRPGKVPFRIVKQRFGDQVLREVTGEVLRTSFQEAIAQQSLRPTGGPRLEPSELGEGRGLRYTATFEVYPDFELASVVGMEIKRPQAEVTDAEVDEMIEKLRAQHKIWDAVDRAAQKGDQVVIDFTGSINGQPFKGNEGKDLSFELGAEQMLDGFEDHLIGATAGDTKLIQLSFPDEHQNRALAGKTADFEVKVKQVSQPRLPALDDEFVKSLGIMEGGVDALREAARANMRRELEQKIKARIKTQAMDGLLQRIELELPETMVKEEIARLRKQAMENLGESDERRFTDELFAEEAGKRVKLGLIVGEIVRKHELKPDSKKVQQTLQALAGRAGDPQQMIDYYRQNPAAMANIEALVIEDQVVDWILAQANVVPEPMSFSELVAPATPKP